MNTKITLSWALKQFVTRVHTLFSHHIYKNFEIYGYPINTWVAMIWQRRVDIAVVNLTITAWRGAHFRRSNYGLIAHYFVSFVVVKYVVCVFIYIHCNCRRWEQTWQREQLDTRAGQIGWQSKIILGPISKYILMYCRALLLPVYQFIYFVFI